MKTEDGIKIHSREGPHNIGELRDLIEFLGLSEQGKGKNIQLYLRLKSLGLELDPKPPVEFPLLHLYLKYFVNDLDFGLIDRLIRKFRKRITLNYLKSQKGYVLLDAGCGRQATLGWAVRNVCKQYIGVDRDIPPVTVSNLRFVKGVVESTLPTVPQGSIDVITALAVIEHLEDPAKFLRECLRILRSGGFVILTTPPPISIPLINIASRAGLISGDEVKEHKGYFDLRSLRVLLETVGFEVAEAKTFLLGFNLFVVGKKP